MFLKINYKPSTSHWIFPPIIIGILVVLGIVMMIQRMVKCKKERRPFVSLKDYHFFSTGYDKVKLWGTLILFVLYILLMPVMHFLSASIIFVFLYNVLYCGIGQVKEAICDIKGHVKPSAACRSLLVSLVISVLFSVGIWYLFGVVLMVSLP